MSDEGKSSLLTLDRESPGLRLALTWAKANSMPVMTPIGAIFIALLCSIFVFTKFDGYSPFVIRIFPGIANLQWLYDTPGFITNSESGIFEMFPQFRGFRLWNLLLKLLSLIVLYLCTYTGLILSFFAYYNFRGLKHGESRRPLHIESNQDKTFCFWQTVDEGLKNVFLDSSVRKISLTVAAEEGDLEEGRRLLDLGIKPDTQPDQWDAPIIAAAKNGHIEFMSLLLEYGADPGMCDDNGRDAYRWFVKENGQKQSEKVQAILAKYRQDNQQELRKKNLSSSRM